MFCYLTGNLCSATPDIIHQAQFALDVKAKVLPLYEELFDVEYPLPKLDSLVVCQQLSLLTHILIYTQASDFDAGVYFLFLRFISSIIYHTLLIFAGAMENWVRCTVKDIRRHVDCPNVRA